MFCLCLTFFNPLVSNFFVKTDLFRRRQTSIKQIIKRIRFWRNPDDLFAYWKGLERYTNHTECVAALNHESSFVEGFVFYLIVWMCLLAHSNVCMTSISTSLSLSLSLLLYPLCPVPQVREETGVSGERRANEEMAEWIRKVSSTVSTWTISSTKHRAKNMVWFNIHSKWQKKKQVC